MADDARQPAEAPATLPEPRRVRGRRPVGRWWHSLLSFLLVLLSLPVFAAISLALRLWIGPVDVTGAARRLLEADRDPAIAFQHMELTWNGWAEGPVAPLGLHATRIRWNDPGVGHGNADQASASFDLPSLLHGRIALLALRAHGGSLYMAGLPAASAGAPARTDPDDAQVTHAAAVPEARPPPRHGRLDLRQLHEVELSNLSLRADEVLQGVGCAADIGTLRISPLRRPAAIGVTGEVTASFSCGGAPVALQGRAREDPEGRVVWHITTGRFVPSSLVPPIPAPALALLRSLAGVRLPVRLTIAAGLSGGFGRFMLPRTLDVLAQVDAGTLYGDAGRLTLRGGKAHLVVELPASRDGRLEATLDTTRLDLDEGASTPVLTLSGSLEQTGRSIAAGLRARIDRFDFDGLEAIWPQALGHGARQWVAENIPAGRGHDLDITVGLASQSGWNGLAVSRLDGGLQGDDLTLFWLRPVPPLTGMQAMLVLEGPDSLRVESSSARQSIPEPGGSEIAVGPTTMRITGLSRKDQNAEIDSRLRGSLPSFLAVLAHPRLRLLSQHPLPFTHPAGAAVADLHVSLPLIEAVQIEDVRIGADIGLAQIHLGNVAAGRDLDAATLSLKADNDGMRVHGQGLVAGQPSRIAYQMDFREGPPDELVEAAQLAAHVTPASLHGAGVALPDWTTGAAEITLDYQGRRSGVSRIALAADLRATGVQTAWWRKSAGAPARASGVVLLDHGRLRRIEAVSATGDGLALDAHADVASGQARAVVIDRFRLGRSQGGGRVDFAAAQRPLKLTLYGPSLDVSPLVAGASARPAPAAGASAPATAPATAMAWRADLAFQKLLFDTRSTRAFGGMRLQADLHGTGIDRAAFSAASPTAIEASLEPDAGGKRVALHARDLGALLGLFTTAPAIRGGGVDIEGRMPGARPGAGPGARPGPGSPAAPDLEAVARVGPFVIEDAPLAARLARDLSVYGLRFGAKHRNLAIRSVVAPFTLTGPTIELADARAFNPALGATLRGPIDLAGGKLDLRGTIVPSYFFNAMPGRLPGVGKLFSPETGGGVLAATLRLSGPLDRPRLRVNPFAMLAPGILRRMLFD